MKQLNKLLLTLLMSGAGTAGAFADPYVCNFDTPISTNNPNFKVASNWKHIVDSYEKAGRYFMSYSYLSDSGVDGSGALKAGEQKAGMSSWYSETVFDLLVTPKVAGAISIDARTNGSGTPFIEVYEYNEVEGKQGDKVHTVDRTELFLDDATAFKTVSLLPEEKQNETPRRLCLRIQGCDVDNFTAENAELVIEKSFEISPLNTTGSTYFKQSVDLSVPVEFKIKITNNGDADLVAGEDNYSITFLNNRNQYVSDPIAIPIDIAKGETSEEFTISYVIPSDIANDYFKTTPLVFELKENLSGSSVKSNSCYLTKYESRFVFCDAERADSYTSALSDPQSWGIVTEDTYKQYQLRNTSPAPYKVFSMELPEGFVFEDEYTYPLTINMGDKLPLNIGLVQAGTHSGNLVIKYKLYGEPDDQDLHEHSIQLSGTKTAEGTWMCDFNRNDGVSTALFPVGTFGLAGISSDYDSSTSSRPFYNCYIQGATYNALFYTPLLHANENDTFTFDVKRTNYANDFKVYVTKDRNSLGDPCFTATGSELSDKFTTKSITIEEEGDYYIVFEIPNKAIDNLVGLTKVDVPHDFLVTEFKLTEEVQNGKTITPSATIAALTNEEASDYAVKFYLGDEAVATATSIDLLHDGKSTKKFDFSYTPEVENTIETTGYIAFEFTDGTILKTEALPIKITNEPYFAFGVPSYSLSATANSAPKSDTKAIEFGTTNKTDLSKAYKIVNWGTAPFTVSSITVPEGFAVDFTEGTLAGKTEQVVNITFPTTTVGTYEGELVIAYNDGEEKEYKLGISGTMLDPTKWYVNFDGGSSEYGIWPEGSIHQGNVTLNTFETYAPYNHYLNSSYSASSPNRMFITPLMKATSGEKMSFDIFRSTSTTSFVKVYAAKKRADLYAADSEGNYGEAILLAEFTPNAEDAAFDLTQERRRVSVTIPEAGEYYIGFELANYGRVDDISGLVPVSVENDLEYDGATIPSTGIQNTITSGNIKLYNYLNNLEAGSYTVKSYVDGVLSIEAEGETVIKADNKYQGTVNTIPVSFRSPKAGTYPVYFEFICGETSFKSETVEVEFAEEVLSSVKVVGSYSRSTSSNAPIATNYKASESEILYTPANLGLNTGDKITKISFKGYRSAWTQSSHIPQITAYYSWVDETTLDKPTSMGILDVSEMTQIYDAPLETSALGTSSSHEDILSFNFEEPLVYPGGKSLKLVVRLANTYYQNAYNFELADDINTCYYHQRDDNPFETLSASWNSGQAPVLSLSLAAEPTQISGVVTDSEDNTVADAVVTLVSTDGDNIQYTGTTNENGAYAINVIQTGREYDVEVKTADKAEFENGVSFADGSVTLDFSLLDILMISDEGDNTNLPANAVMYVEKSLNPGFNAVAFPIALSKEEVEEIFGEDVVVLEFDAVTTDAAAAVVNFSEVADKTMEAGKPYLIFADQESKEVKFRTKGAPSALKTTSTETNDFLATDKRMAMEEGMFVLTNGNFEGKKNARTRAAVELPAYSGYIKAPNATSLTFTTDVNIETSIEEAEVVKVGNDVIYDLNGVRVKNPAKGIYIINGKPVMVK